MWNDYLQALFTALALSGMGFGIGKLVVFLGERSIEKRHGITGLREMIARRAKLESGLEARKTERTAELRTVDAEVESLMNRRRTLERKLRDAQRAGDEIVRLAGEEVTGLRCHVAMVTNKYVGAAGHQQQHAFLDSSWARPQTIEVWARNIQDARGEVERRYPPSFGYVITRMQDMGTAGEPVAKAG